MAETDFVPTRGSSVKRKAAENFEVVFFESYKPKNKQRKAETATEDAKNTSKDTEFNIKKAKHEIVKFAVSGMEGSEKEEAKVRLAIQLGRQLGRFLLYFYLWDNVKGAKPKKNKYKNYKQLKEEKQKEKQMKLKEVEELGKDSMGMSNVTTKSSKYKRKEGTGGLLEVYGKVSKVSASTYLGKLY